MTRVAVEVAVEPPYRVHVGTGALDELAPLASRRLAVLTDTTVEELHGARLAVLGGAARLALPPGERHKDLATLERVLEFLAERGLDRGSLLVTFGGGVVCDLGGLAAALYMRGIEVLHVPTTLLAQVDAAVGGKTAVNLRAGKNLAGTFHAPRAVLADPRLLATLRDADLRSGLGEALKSGVLGAPGLLALLEDRAAALLAREPGALASVVEACVRHKAGVVAADPRDRGARRALNLGHTFAHAIEREAGYGVVPHGVAVALGVLLSAELSRALGLLAEPDLPGRVRSLLAALGLPTSLTALRRATGAELAAGGLLDAMRRDKKAEGGRLRLVLPRGLGRLELGAEVDEPMLAELLGAFRSS